MEEGQRFKRKRVSYNNNDERREQSDFRIKRNARILSFFNLAFPEETFKLIGNLNTPAIIHNNKTVLSCYAHNFDFHFTDIPKEGEITYSIKLNHNQEFNKEEVEDWFYNAEHRECFSIGVKGTNLRLSGYNFLHKDKINPTGKYPVFSEHNFKLYFDDYYAKEIVMEYRTEDLPLEII